MENETTGQDQLQHVKCVIESLLFVNERPVTIDQIRKVIETVTPLEIKKAMQILQDEYDEQDRGMTVREIAGGYQMLSNSQYASYIRDFYKTKHKEKLSKPALEALAIIAYKQPVTRADIEIVRGVNSDGVVSNLLEKELLKIIGRKDIPGKPYLYGTTKLFLEYFGLKSLDDLPKLEDLPELEPTKEDEILPIEEEEGGGQQGVEAEGQQGNEESAQNNEQTESSPAEQTQERVSSDQPFEDRSSEQTSQTEAETQQSVSTATEEETESKESVTAKAEKFLEEAERRQEEKYNESE